MKIIRKLWCMIVGHRSLVVHRMSYGEVHGIGVVYSSIRGTVILRCERCQETNTVDY